MWVLDIKQGILFQENDALHKMDIQQHRPHLMHIKLPTVFPEYTQTVKVFARDCVILEENQVKLAKILYNDKAG